MLPATVDLIYIRLSNIFNIQFNRCGCSIHSNVLSISRLDCSIWLHVLFPRSPAGPPLLIRRSRLPLPSPTNYYASIVNTSCFDRRVDLLFRTRKRREETGIRTADLILIHVLENDALDRSATVGRLGLGESLIYIRPKIKLSFVKYSTKFETVALN